MSRVGNQAAVLTLSRLTSYGLMLISPIILVRLLSIEQFGLYREFLLYTSVLQSLAVFSINQSLLYCIPAEPASRWRTVRQTSILIGAASVLVVGATAALDLATGGRIVGGFLLTLCAYTLLSSNLDFWDYFFVATERTAWVFAYSAARLTARVVVATVAAAVSHDAWTIIWSLIALEAVRVAAVAAVMLLVEKTATEPPLAEPWRDQLRYCLPSGAASTLSMLNRNLGSLVVTKVLGPISLAQYTIGRFGEPVVVTLRSSISGVVLPEMVRRGRGSREDSYSLWRRATAVNVIMLFPVVVLIERFATPLVVAVFGRNYAAAAIVLKIYMVVLVRECFDFAPALRALNRTRPLVESNVASLLVCGLMLALLVPAWGIAGAMTAIAIGAWVDGLWLGYRTMATYGLGLGGLIPWTSIFKTSAGALLAGLILLTPVWGQLGFGGIVLAAIGYLGIFALLILAMRVPEAQTLLEWFRRLLPHAAAASRRA